MKKTVLATTTSLMLVGLTACSGTQHSVATSDKTHAERQIVQLPEASSMKAKSTQAKDFEGRWVGNLSLAPSNTIQLILNINAKGDTIDATIDVPAQGQSGIAFDRVQLDENGLFLGLTAAGIRIEGKLENGKIVGRYKQGGFAAPMEFSLQAQANKRKAKPLERNPMSDYQVSDVTFENTDAGHRLAGTLTIPTTHAKHTVIILSGSGATTRDGDMLGHKVYAVLADQLTKQGVAVLRFDDRGVGESGGNHAIATSADFATDANAALQYLRQHDELKHTKIGFIGHSEGGLIAAIAQTLPTSPKADFFVSLAGPGTSGEQILVDQSTIMQELHQVPSPAKEHNIQLQKDTMAAVARGASKTELTSIMMKAGLPRERAEKEAAGLSSPWAQFFIQTNVQDYLKQMQIPVLALNGAKDVQVIAKPNIDGIKKAVDEKWLTFKIYPELNHLFQPATTGLPEEYGQIETTISPDVAKDIRNWLAKL